MKLRTALLAATVLAAPGLAIAQPVNGLYIGGGVGYNILQDSDLSFSNNGAPLNAGNQSGKAEFDGGWAALGSIGWGFGNGLRAEIEGNYRRNNVDKGRVGTATLTDIGGRAQTYGVMANVLFDIDLGLGWVYPYIGAGAGYAWTKWDINSNGSIVDDTDGQFAYQGIVGAAFPIDAVPGLSITAEYRYFATLDPEFSIEQTAGGGKVEGENRNHTFLLGVRYAFNVAPPAPPPAAPAAAPAPARTFLVFFDWDRADLTDRARQIISEAASTSKRVEVTTIEVSGHADLTGSPAYNQRLSLRRANNVAAELVRQGVPQSAITIQAFGDTRPLVPTARGVREPQNRRVEIVLK